MRRFCRKGGKVDYDMVMPLLLGQILSCGNAGMGITALLASFMSGMAGNVTAFNTVWTYDIYSSYIKPGQSDEHYLTMGKIATVAGVLISIGTAYVTLHFNNIMDYLQLIFSFVNAPLFATFLLGMFWKRATANGAFWGLAAGTGAAGLHYFATMHGWVNYRSDMAGNFSRAIFAWTVCFVLTLLISLFTKPRAEAELHGLVYSLTEKPKYRHLGIFHRPMTLAVAVLVICVVLDVVFR